MVSCWPLVKGAVIGWMVRIIELERELVEAGVRVTLCSMVEKKTPVFYDSDAAEAELCLIVKAGHAGVDVSEPAELMAAAVSETGVETGNK